MDSAIKVLGLFLLIIIVLVGYLVKILHQSVQNHMEPPTQNAFSGGLSKNTKRDCAAETIFSMNDQHCNTICNTPGTYVSINGVCVDTLAFDESAVENKCNPSKGKIAYLLGDPMLGRTEFWCLSVDLGIVPDRGEDNYLCSGGSMDIDYLLNFPQLSDCVCPQGMFIAAIKNTSVVRLRGVCVPDALRAVYELNKLVV